MTVPHSGLYRTSSLSLGLCLTSSFPVFYRSFFCAPSILCRNRMYTFVTFCATHAKSMALRRCYGVVGSALRHDTPPQLLHHHHTTTPPQLLHHHHTTTTTIAPLPATSPQHIALAPTVIALPSPPPHHGRPYIVPSVDLCRAPGSRLIRSPAKRYLSPRDAVTATGRVIHIDNKY